MATPTSYVGIGTAIAWTNQPAAITFLNGVDTNRFVADTRDCNEVRLTLTVSTAGASGASILVRYRTTDDATAANWTLSPLASGGALAVDLTGTGIKDTGWVALAPGAKGPAIYFAMLGLNGDGVADPVVGAPTLMFR